MEMLSETRKRSSESEEEKPRRQRRSGSDAMEFLTDRAKMNYELKQQEFKMLQEQQALERNGNGKWKWKQWPNSSYKHNSNKQKCLK